MKFEKTEVFNFEGAIRGMRNPLESWEKSDSGYCSKIDCDECPKEKNCKSIGSKEFIIGKNDLELAQKLIRAGSVHRKFMRQIFVSVDITASLYWWKEFDTYKVGTVANSTSTMHKLATTPITKDCFEMDDFQDFTFVIQEDEFVAEFYNSSREWENQIRMLETLRLKYLETKNKKYWKELIRLLPESWLQKRTVTMNYENLLAICSVDQRRNHKLTEWSKSFIDWAKSLPYSNELLFIK